MSKSGARPFLKWAGGKTQLTHQLLERTPKNFENYLEPFVGGGAFFFALYRGCKIRRAILSDLNLELIDTYRAIQQEVEHVIELLINHKRRHSEQYYYRVRSWDPETLDYTKKAARMIYLNKTCYNGLYRVNRQGKFNVPFGSYKSPRICDEENLREVSTALKNVKLECKSFEDVLNAAGKNDLVYFDPPYDPISKTANFTAYQALGFTRDSQVKLSEVCHQLHKKKVKFILSNSSSKRVHDLYTSNGFYLHKVKAMRAINSNPKKRGKLTELIVTNYPTEHD